MTTHTGLLSSESAEWYTPSLYIDAVRAVLGSIDLDPASCEYANTIVKATRYYTKEQNGLMQAWKARSVYCNPPYGKSGSKSNQAIWTCKALAEYHCGNVTDMILLVNAATGDKWFDVLKPYWLCLTPRIHFYTERGTPTQPTHGNAFVYVGENSKGFADVFHHFGRIVPPDPYADTEQVIAQELWSLLGEEK